MICPFCAEEIKDQAILCRFCGKDVPKLTGSTSKSDPSENEEGFFEGGQGSNFPKENIFSKFTKIQKIIAVSVIVVLMLGVGSIGINKYSQEKEKNRIAALVKAEADAEAAALKAEMDAYEAAIRDTSWVPEGYRKFMQNPYMAWKINSSKCASYGQCYPLDVVTSKYCDSIYIAANLERRGVVIDFANDSANGISAGKVVKMKLQWTEDSGDNVGWVDANCR